MRRMSLSSDVAVIPVCIVAKSVCVRGRFSLCSLPMTDEKVKASRAIDMLHMAGDRINACGVSIGFLRHPAACFRMHQAALQAHQQYRRRRLRETGHTSVSRLYPEGHALDDYPQGQQAISGCSQMRKTPRHVPTLPLDVCHLKQGKIVFKREPVKVVKREIGFHRLAEILNGDVQLPEFRVFRGRKHTIT